MRKIIVQEFITLDGVMQAPGGPEEDTSGGFRFGGWTAPYFQEADSQAGELMQKWLQPTDLLLGRKTFDIFAAYWPTHAEMWPGIMEVTKYCVSATLEKTDWVNSVFLKNVEDIKKLKMESVPSDAAKSPDIQVIGSGDLAQTLFKHDLVDELRLMTYPITLGQGKRLFGEGTIPAAFTLKESMVTSNGVIFACYERAGEVQTGTVG